MNILYFVLFFFFARAGVPCFRWTISRCVRSTCLPVAFFARFIGSMPPPPPTPVFERYPPHTSFLLLLLLLPLSVVCVFLLRCKLSRSTIPSAIVSLLHRPLCLYPPPLHPRLVSPLFIYLLARNLSPQKCFLYSPSSMHFEISPDAAAALHCTLSPRFYPFFFLLLASLLLLLISRDPQPTFVLHNNKVFFFTGRFVLICAFCLSLPLFLFAFAFALSYASPSPHLPHSLAMSSCGAFWYLLVGVLVIPLLLLVGTASLIFYFHFFMRVTDAKWGRLDSFSSCYLSIAFLRGFESCVSLSFFLSIFFFFFLLSVCVIVAF